MGIKKIKIELTKNERDEIEEEIASVLEEAAGKDTYKALKQLCDNCDKNFKTCWYNNTCEEYRSIKKEREWRYGKETQAVAVAKIMEYMPVRPSVPSPSFKAFVKMVVKTVTLEEWAFELIIETLTTKGTSKGHESKGIIFVNNNEARDWDAKIEAFKATGRYASWCDNHGSSPNPVFVEIAETDAKGNKLEPFKLFAEAVPYKRVIKLTPLDAPPEVKKEFREIDENATIRELVEGSFYSETLIMENPSLMEPETPVIKLEQDIGKQEEDNLEDQYKIPELEFGTASPIKEYVRWSRPGKNMPGVSNETQLFEKDHKVKDWMVVRGDTKRKNKRIETLQTIVNKHLDKFVDGWKGLGMKENRKLLIKLYYEKTGKVLDDTTLRRYIKDIVPLEESEKKEQPDPQHLVKIESDKAWELRSIRAVHIEPVNSVQL